MCVFESKAVFFSSSNLIKCRFACIKLEQYHFFVTEGEEYKIYTYLQNKRMRRCGVPPPPPIIFERLKLPQQIIYRLKENLSESPNHQKYWENILVSRFYEQF